MIRRRTLLAATGGALLGSAAATGTAHADATIAVNPGTSYGTWEGWGTSLAWWANVFLGHAAIDARIGGGKMVGELGFVGYVIALYLLVLLAILRARRRAAAATSPR